MTTPAAPRGVLTIEAGPSYRAYLENPYGPYTSSDKNRPVTVRIYRATHVGATFTPHVDLPIAHQDPEITRLIELEFTSDTPGTFALAYLNAQEVPETSSLTGLQFVYTNPLLLARKMLDDECISGITIANLLSEARAAADYIERITERFFYPKWIELKVNGEGLYDLVLEHPIVSVSELHVREDTNRAGRDSLIAPSSYVVFNRHVQGRKRFDPIVPTRPDGFLDAPGDGSGGLTNPDDREAPQIRFRSPNRVHLGVPSVRSQLSPYTRFQGPGSIGIRDTGFHVGNQNILVRGWFGYTAPDLSTPSDIFRLGDLLAERQTILRWGSKDIADRERMRHLTIMEKTDTHLWMGEAKNRLAGPFTGDPEIDQLLIAYRRQGQGGVV